MRTKHTVEISSIGSLLGHSRVCFCKQRFSNNVKRTSSGLRKFLPGDKQKTTHVDRDVVGVGAAPGLCPTTLLTRTLTNLLTSTTQHLVRAGCQATPSADWRQRRTQPSTTRPIQRLDDHKSKKPDGRSELQVTAQQQIECKADSGYVVLSFRNKHTDRIPYHN